MSHCDAIPWQGKAYLHVICFSRDLRFSLVSTAVKKEGADRLLQTVYWIVSAHGRQKRSLLYALLPRLPCQLFTRSAAEEDRNGCLQHSLYARSGRWTARARKAHYMTIKKTIGKQWPPTYLAWEKIRRISWAWPLGGRLHSRLSPAAGGHWGSGSPGEKDEREQLKPQPSFTLTINSRSSLNEVTLCETFTAE